MSALRTAASIAPAEVATQLAAREDVWRDLVRFDEGARTYTRVEETSGWEAWLLTWWPGTGTGVHDHGGATGAIVVARRQPARAGLVSRRLRRTGPSGASSGPGSSVPSGLESSTTSAT